MSQTEGVCPNSMLLRREQWGRAHWYTVIPAPAYTYTCTWAVILVVSSSAEDDSKPDCCFCPLAVPCCFCPAAPARAGRPSHPVVSQLLPETAREKWTRKNMKQTCLKVRARKITKVLQSVAHKENLRYMSKVGDCELFICCDMFSKDDNLFLKALCRVSRV